MKNYLLIFLIISLIFITGCQTFNNVNINSNGCEEKAKALLPKYIQIAHDYLGQYRWQIMRDTPFTSKWNDETIMNIGNQDTTLAFLCTSNNLLSKGSQEGQNVNYYYINGDCYFTYSKQIVSTDGTIKGTTIFKFKPVLNLSNRPSFSFHTSYGEGNVVIDTFEVVDPVITECNWVD